MNYIFGKKPLIIFELAGNHSGKIENALEMVTQIARLKRESVLYQNFDFAVKTQYRQLDTFIHKDYQNNFDYKYIKRFTETRLSVEEYNRIHRLVGESGLIRMTTPFDERSVDLANIQDLDIIKVASCSFTDWPLLNKIAELDKPIILSTATAGIEDMKHVVDFFLHRDKHIALMHCVGEYPTPPENMHLNQIDFLRREFPDITIGLSTHESIEEFDTPDIACAKGCMIYEFHYGLDGELNKYSKERHAARGWLDSLVMSYIKCGESSIYPRATTQKEVDDLRGLRRAVWAKRDIEFGEKITRDDVYYAIPTIHEHQILANEMSKYNEMYAVKSIKKDEQLNHQYVEIKYNRHKIQYYANLTSKMLDNAHIKLPKKYDFSISHHYGLDNFSEYGAVLIDIVNKEYCKKYMIMFPRQSHPEHFHAEKVETFFILYGGMRLGIDGVWFNFQAGDLITVEKGQKHSFIAGNDGVIFEEISTTSIKGDSYYTDKSITDNRFRKVDVRIK